MWGSLPKFLLRETSPNFERIDSLFKGIYTPKLKDKLQLVTCQELKMPKFSSLNKVARRLANEDTQEF